MLRRITAVCGYGCKDTVFFVPEQIIPLHFIPAALHFIK